MIANNCSHSSRLMSRARRKHFPLSDFQRLHSGARQKTRKQTINVHGAHNQTCTKMYMYMHMSTCTFHLYRRSSTISYLLLGIQQSPLDEDYHAGSCRGDSEGFAHASCLVNYAEQKCEQANEVDCGEAFIEPWYKCNNCKQPFQGQLSIDLSYAFVSFAEATLRPRRKTASGINLK